MKFSGYFVFVRVRKYVMVSVVLSAHSLMLNQIALDISSVGRSTYTYKSVNCVNVYGRDVTLDLGRVYIYARISVSAF